MPKDFAMDEKRAGAIALTILLVSASGAFAQIPPPTITMTPHPNPSSSLVLPPPGELPVSPVTPGTSRGSTGVNGCCYGTHQIVEPPPNHAGRGYHRRRRHPASLTMIQSDLIGS
jgi:hypothetical protein